MRTRYMQFYDGFSVLEQVKFPGFCVGIWNQPAPFMSLQPPIGNTRTYLYILYPEVFVASLNKHKSFCRLPNTVPWQPLRVDTS